MDQIENLNGKAGRMEVFFKLVYVRFLRGFALKSPLLLKTIVCCSCSSCVIWAALEVQIHEVYPRPTEL